MVFYFLIICFCFSSNPVYLISHAENRINLINPPSTLAHPFLINVKYSCEESYYVRVHIEVQTCSQKEVSIFKKRFFCSKGSKEIKKTFLAKLPSYIIYKPSYQNKYSVHLIRATLKAWLAPKNLTHYFFSKFKTESPLEVVPTLERPSIPENWCIDWWKKIFNNVQYWPQCPLENEKIEILSYPLALSGQRSGLVRKIEPFVNPVLRHNQASSRVNFNITFLFWIFIEEYCPNSLLCSIAHHAKWDDLGFTPFILINRKGQIHLEVVSSRREVLAYLSYFKLPKHQWLALTVTCSNGNIWDLRMNQGEDFKNYTHQRINVPRDKKIFMDDTKGVFHFGGSNMFFSFQGILGKVQFFRTLNLSPSRFEIPDQKHSMFLYKLSEQNEKCLFYKNKAAYFKLHNEELYKKFLGQKKCETFFSKFFSMYVIPTLKDPLCLLRDASRPSKFFRFLWKAMRKMVFLKRRDDLRKLPETLLIEAYSLMENYGLEKIKEIISLLKQSCCYNNHEAGFLLSVIYDYGFSVEVDEMQSHSFLLKSSSFSNRLALLTMGNKHVYGIDGVSRDLEQAYAYYMSAAYLTKTDISLHQDHDTFTENIRLSNEQQVKMQTGEGEDLFEWFQHQASKGVVAAQKHMARMLYWGFQGVNRNKSVASTYYKKAAESGNADALYDYGIILLKGHGVQKNLTLALEKLEEAASFNHSKAFNTLGWYQLVHLKNYSRAADYFEKSFRLGNADAGHNLAHMLLNGIFPDLNRTEKVLAWNFFSKAAMRGNFDSGLLVAMYNMVGHPKTVRSPELSVEWARFLSEQNPALGRLLKIGVRKYREKNWQASLLFYLMAASTGSEVANFNLAYLCEENHNYLSSSLKKDCTRRHFNFSTLRSSKSKNPYAWLKMADYYYNHKNISMAIKTYADSAVKGDIQAFFNLGLLVEEGWIVEDDVWRKLRVPFNTTRNKCLLLIHIFSSCKDSKSSEAHIPCLLSLSRVTIHCMWTKYHRFIKTFMVGMGILGMVFMVTRGRRTY